jgi:hypothetical protein
MPFFTKGKRRGKYRKYKPEQMAAALEELKGVPDATLEGVAAKHGVPYTSLQNHKDREEKGLPVRRSGRPDTLTFTEQLLVITWMLVMRVIGFPPTKAAILDKAKEVLSKRNGKFRTKSGKPGRKWWSRFKTRWKHQFTMQKPSRLSQAKAKLTREALNAWYDRLGWIINHYGIRQDDIFNLDETGLDKGLGGNEPVAVGVGSGRAVKIGSELSQHVTILSTIRSNGAALPPFYIFRGKEGADVNRKWDYDPLKGAPAGSCMARTGTKRLSYAFDVCSVEKGWITRATFAAYIKFFAAVLKPSPDRRALLLVDNHESRFDHDMMQFAFENNIVLCSLPPQSTDRIQPLDVGCHGPFKAALSKAIDELPASTKIGPQNIAEITAQPWLDAMSPENIRHSFETTGIAPLDREAISDEDLAPSQAFVQATHDQPVFSVNNIIPVPDHLKHVFHIPSMPIPPEARKQGKPDGSSVLFTDKATIELYRKAQEKKVAKAVEKANKAQAKAKSKAKQSAKPKGKNRGRGRGRGRGRARGGRARAGGSDSETEEETGTETETETETESEGEGEDETEPEASSDESDAEMDAEEKKVADSDGAAKKKLERSERSKKRHVEEKKRADSDGDEKKGETLENSKKRQRKLTLAELLDGKTMCTTKPKSLSADILNKTIVYKFDSNWAIGQIIQFYAVPKRKAQYNVEVRYDNGKRGGERRDQKLVIENYSCDADGAVSSWAFVN